MISVFLKLRLKSLQKNSSGATLIEFAMVGGFFIFALLSTIELFLYQLYMTTVESAISKGIERTAMATTLIDGNLIATHSRLRNDINILDTTEIENNVPDFYDMFVGNTAAFDIATGNFADDDYNTASGGLALSSHNNYRISFTADWDPISPYLKMAGIIPIEIVVHYNDY